MTIGVNYNLERQVLISTPQAFTTSWADLGSEISMTGFSNMGIWITLDVNAANNMRIRALAKLDSAGTSEYNLLINTVSASDIKVEAEYYEWNADADGKFLLEVETSGLVPWVQLQIQVGTDGGDDAEVDYCEITKVWR